MEVFKLFYRRGGDVNFDLVEFIRSNGVQAECLCVDDHREQYDHDDPSLSPTQTHGSGASCFCDEPDYTDPKWPKLHYGFKNFVASGEEDIRKVDFSKYKG
jgi:hypothetical protein